jgi:hypothetical protein
MAIALRRAYDTSTPSVTLSRRFIMSKHKCCEKGKCCHAFDKAKDAPKTPPAPPANDQKSDAPKKKCCGGSCHPK